MTHDKGRLNLPSKMWLQHEERMRHSYLMGHDSGASLGCQMRTIRETLRSIPTGTHDTETTELRHCELQGVHTLREPHRRRGSIRESEPRENMSSATVNLSTVTLENLTMFQ